MRPMRRSSRLRSEFFIIVGKSPPRMSWMLSAGDGGGVDASLARWACAGAIGDAIAEPGAPREIGGDAAELGGEVEAGDAAAEGRGEVARRTADAAADIEHMIAGAWRQQRRELDGGEAAARVELVDRR